MKGEILKLMSAIGTHREKDIFLIDTKMKK